MGGHLPTAASFLDSYDREIAAALTVVAALVLAKVVDRAVAARGSRMRAAVGADELSPVATTRLRLVRRLLSAAILLIGFALALSQFEGVRRIAAGVLASSAVLGLVVGFAARQTLANAVAGVLIAVTQPIRIGDLVTFEGATGVVEDVRLTYTYIRGDDARRIIVPNERLASATIENHTIADPRVRVEVSVWLPPEADLDRALAVVGAGEDVEVSVADADKDGVRLSATTWVASPDERGGAAAALRADSLRRLREEGLSWAVERQ
ncbi:MAG: mechanosensitive ion channel family protein [Actinomycetota bacterium]|nr:mechanosensitive ion channel family protein [Actinomycetota bacterium]